MKSFYKGYKNYASNADVFWGLLNGESYIERINQGIDQVVSEMRKTVIKRFKAKDYSIKGFVAEDYHAGTFNIDVAVKSGRNIFAEVDKSNHCQADVWVHHNNELHAWQMKYYNTAEDTAKELSKVKYNDIGKVAPSDQFSSGDIKSYSTRQALRNKDTRPDTAEAYQDTAINAKAFIEEVGYSSKGLSDKDALQIVEEIKKSTFDPEKYGLSIENFINMEAILKQSVQSGVNAAILTLVLKIGPEICNIIYLFIDKGTIDKNQISKLGLAALNESTTSFIRGSIASAVMISCQSGILGNSFKNVSPTVISYLTVIVMNTVHNSIGVALGKMTKDEFIEACSKDCIISTFSFGGGFMMQNFIPVPVIGFMLGSLIGSVVGSFVYDGIKNITIAICVDKGYTFFGLVEQDYTLPEEILEKIGIRTFKFSKFRYNEFNYKNFQYSQYTFNNYNYKKIDFVFLQRGIIGVNKVGYI